MMDADLNAENESKKLKVSIARIGVLLFVVVGMFLILSTAVSAFRYRLETNKQVQTANQLQGIAAEVEKYRHDNGHYPEAETIEDLNALLNRRFEGNDRWGHPIMVRSFQDRYSLVSAGADGDYEYSEAEEYPEGEILGLDPDIVLINGRFRTWPIGSHLGG